MEAEVLLAVSGVQHHGERGCMISWRGCCVHTFSSTSASCVCSTINLVGSRYHTQCCGQSELLAGTPGGAVRSTSRPRPPAGSFAGRSKLSRWRRGGGRGGGGGWGRSQRPQPRRQSICSHCWHNIRERDLLLIARGARALQQATPLGSAPVRAVRSCEQHSARFRTDDVAVWSSSPDLSRRKRGSLCFARGSWTARAAPTHTQSHTSYNMLHHLISRASRPPRAPAAARE